MPKAKPPASPSVDPFVVELGQRYGRELYAGQPNLSAHALSERAYELWSSKAASACEDEGLDPDDEHSCDRFGAELEAAYLGLRQAAGPVPVWETPSLNQLRAKLSAAGIGEPRLARLDTFIADSDLDEFPAEQVAQFCELLEFVFGLRDAFPQRWHGEQPYFEIDADTWAGLFAEPAGWDAVEQRLCQWIWQLPVQRGQLGRDIVFDLAPAGIRAQPDADVFERVRELLRSVDEPESAILSRAIERCMYAALTETHALTSFGRHLLAAGFDTVFPLAEKHRRVPHYATLLLQHAPEVFAAHTAQFEDAVADNEAWKLDLAEPMLRCDPARYADTVLRWAASLTTPGLRSHMAIYLCEAFGEQQRALVLDMTRQAIADFGDQDSPTANSLRADPRLAAYAEFPNSSVKLCLVATVLRAYGEAGFSAVREFELRKDGWMIRYYELLGEFLPGHPGAREQLVAGLLKRLPSSLGGQLTYEAYVERLVAALASFELGPEREAIEARFADEANPRVRASIARLLGSRT